MCFNIRNLKILSFFKLLSCNISPKIQNRCVSKTSRVFGPEFTNFLEDISPSFFTTERRAARAFSSNIGLKKLKLSDTRSHPTKSFPEVLLRRPPTRSLDKFAKSSKQTNSNREMQFKKINLRFSSEEKTIKSPNLSSHDGHVSFASPASAKGWRVHDSRAAARSIAGTVSLVGVARAQPYGRRWVAGKGATVPGVGAEFFK